MTALAFRFDSFKHIYTLNDAPIPSITQMIERGGLLGKGAAFYTEASRDRGTEVHRLCTDYDLGALNPATVTDFRGYLLAYVDAVKSLKPTWDEIEEADVHDGYKFAGRIDRFGKVFKRVTVAEIKSAAPAKHHAIQTALQAILKSARCGLPAERIQRLAIYLKESGRVTAVMHEDRRDFDTAMRLIKEFC